MAGAAMPRGTQGAERQSGPPDASATHPCSVAFCKRPRPRRATPTRAASGCSAADRQGVDEKRWLAHADGNALAVLPAGADARIEAQVVADHADLGEDVGAVADQCRPLHRRADLAALDQIGFGGREDKFARGDIHLAAADIDRIKAALDRAKV